MESPHHEPPDEEPTEKHAEEPAVRNTISGEVTGGRVVQARDVVSFFPEILALVAAGAPAAVTTAMVTYIKHRTTDVSLKITRKDGTTLELQAKRVSEPEQLIERVTEELESGSKAEVVEQDGPDPDADPAPS
ncbi:hypothetical protein IDM40_25070 [Nocardiopsis sp. HNM0947]|uniref:Uncharacterized protein n=1 Tax=Nocardiopsis coralli TaxID=2772213 RepID=A0ABR9PDM5_9ACTN|nr:hypothetical protein [Nocardiopsis coralli]MBE3001942.1 hypothetical protein [Nocardiopsis coralli]